MRNSMRQGMIFCTGLPRSRAHFAADIGIAVGRVVRSTFAGGHHGRQPVHRAQGQCVMSGENPSNVIPWIPRSILTPSTILLAWPNGFEPFKTPLYDC